MTDFTPEPPPIPLAIRLDIEAFLPFLADADLSDADKRAFIETLWSIVVSFVDLGFALNPTQQVCGEVFDLNRVLGADLSISDDALLETKLIEGEVRS